MRFQFMVGAMKKILIILALLLTLGLPAAHVSVSPAQGASNDLAGAIKRLKNNPRYRGRVLGSQVRQTPEGPLYEVRILRRDDRVIVVYIDPGTGGVVGDSERRDQRWTDRKRPRNNRLGNPPVRNSFGGN